MGVNVSQPKIKIEADNKNCLFKNSNQYPTKRMFVKIKKGTDKLKIAKIGSFSGDMKGNK
jgi:hypothetical protein